MSEEKAITAVQSLPATVESLARELSALGVAEGSIVLVHSSLSALGWVCGGPVAVIEALRRAVGESGTLVMPTQSSELSDPSNWENPPVPRDWWSEIRDSMPAFDAALTPSRGMGRIAELFRHYPGALRSQHPQLSFAALGPAAQPIIAGHHPGDGLGEQSPLGRLYDLKAAVLLLGVGHSSNTSLHLGERRAIGDSGPVQATGAPLWIDGKRQWVEFAEPELDESDFGEIGDSFATASGLVKRGMIGTGEGRLMPLPELVDFGTQWIAKHRLGRALDESPADEPSTVELQLSDDPETFSQWTRQVEALLGGRWTRQLEGLDQSYWDLNVDGTTLTVHREHHLGVSVFGPACDEGRTLIQRIDSQLLGGSG